MTLPTEQEGELKEKLRNVMEDFSVAIEDKKIAQANACVDAAMTLIHSAITKAVEGTEIIGRAKELEAGDILPDIAFEIGCEWYIQGVKVPKYLARKISNAAKERRDKLLAQLSASQSECMARTVDSTK